MFCSDAQLDQSETLSAPTAAASGARDQEAAGARAEEEVRGDGAAPQRGGEEARREGAGRSDIIGGGGLKWLTHLHLIHLSLHSLMHPSLLFSGTLTELKATVDVQDIYFSTFICITCLFHICNDDVIVMSSSQCQSKHSHDAN